LFSNTLSLHSSLNVRDHVTQPYSTTGNITILYILILRFLVKFPGPKMREVLAFLTSMEIFVVV